MCGRDALFLEQDDREERFYAKLVTEGGEDYRLRLNIAPGDHLEVITNEESGQITQLRWGAYPVGGGRTKSRNDQCSVGDRGRETVVPGGGGAAAVLEETAAKTCLAAEPAERRALCQPYPGDDFDAYQISTSVNDPSNDRASIIAPDDTAQAGLGAFT